MAKETKNKKTDTNALSNIPIAAIKQTQVASFDELETYKRIRNKRKKRAVLRALVWVLVVLFMPVLIFASTVIINPRETHNFFGYTFFVVTSDSMKGVFEKGDLIVTKKVRNQSELKVGTDIAFVRQSDGQIVTHRITNIKENEKGELEYNTKGVNNPEEDVGTRKLADIIGRRVAVSTFLGKVIVYFRTPLGIVTFLGILVAIIAIFMASFRYSNDIRAVGES